MSISGKHSVQLIPGTTEISLLLFADDVILLSNTIVGLQNQLDSLKREANRLYLAVNLEENKHDISYGWSPRYTRRVVVWYCSR